MILYYITFELEVTNLSVNVKPEASTAAELQHYAPRTPVVAGAVADAHGIGVSVELAIVNALNTVY